MNSCNLKDREWKTFKIEEIFYISTGAAIPKTVLKNGKTPRVSAKEENNGILGLFEANTHKKYREKTNFISASFLGGFFYHPYNASLDMKIHSLETICPSLTRNIALFLITALKSSLNSVSYGKQLSSSSLPKKNILLPVTEEGNIDWDFMELYIMEKEKSALSKYKKYLKNKLDYLKNSTMLEGELHSKKWKEFKINKIFFDLKRGKRLKNENHIHGKMPFVSALGTNNGVDDYISNEDNVRIFSKCLTLANTGNSAGSCFYQPFEFVASDHVTNLANNNFNRYIYLFIGSILSRLSEKYGFSREISNNRLKKEKIMLPIDDDGNPDWDFMESYMKRLEYKKISKHLGYIENRV